MFFFLPIHFCNFLFLGSQIILFTSFLPFHFLSFLSSYVYKLSSSPFFCPFIFRHFSLLTFTNYPPPLFCLFTSRRSSRLRFTGFRSLLRVTLQDVVPLPVSPAGPVCDELLQGAGEAVRRDVPRGDQRHAHPLLHLSLLQPGLR